MIDDIQTDEAAPDTPLLFGRVLDGRGGGRAVTWDEAQAWQPTGPDEVLWVHLRRYLPGVAEWLRDDLGLPEPTIELLTSDDNRPRALREGDAIVATLRGINFNPDAEPEDMVSMQLWSDGRRLITLRRRPQQTPHAIMREIDAGQGPVDAGAAITALIEHMIARMNHAIVDTNQMLDQLEDTDPGDDAELMLDKIAAIRRNCLALKRHMAPQHEALERISRYGPDWFEEHDRRQIAEAIARLRRYLDDLDISKESALVLQDDLRARAVAATQRTQNMLTIVAGIFLPLTFITGLLGINVGDIPLSNPGSHGFWIVVLLCLGIFAVELMVARKMKWF